MIWSSLDLVEALKVEVHPSIHGEKIQFNSNSIGVGDIFIALKGSGDADGHNYAIHALECGAKAVIISRPVIGLPCDKIIMVSDTLIALYQMAEYKRQKSKAKFICVTGSSGKTSTKEILKTMLSCYGSTFASRGNFNNYLGVPINLASMPDNVDYAILEIGMSTAGEISPLTKMVKPDISLITTISAAHLENFESMQGIVDAKCEIFAGMSKDGIAIINIDNQYYNQVLQNLEKLSINKIFTFGKSPIASLQLESYKQIEDNVDLRYSLLTGADTEGLNRKSINVQIPLIPQHIAMNYATALQVLVALDLDINSVIDHLGKIPLMRGRGEIVNVKYNGCEHQIICDYYNANPESVKASLTYLKQLKANKKLIILGDMLELGKNSIKLHQDLIPIIVDSKATRIFLIGDNTKYIYQLLPKSIEKLHFNNVDLLIQDLNELLNENEMILIKGSRSIRLDRIMESFEVIQEITQ